MNRIAVYPGSFDPVTLGHLDIIKRSAQLFDEIVVAVLNNSRKKPLFSVNERKRMLIEATQSFEHVSIDSFDGLLVDYMVGNGLSIILRGLRAISDFDYELPIASTNKHLNCSIETCFMMCSARYSFLSSSAVKEIARYGGNVTDLVPDVTDRFLKERYCVY
ncbi:MAG: pantetheine-phosphate adenylyltransferase [Sporolactobacillus sp.]